MEIFINNEPLNFQLENEKNLKEVIDAINDWLFNQGKIIEQIVINGKSYNGEIENLKKININKIKKLELSVVDVNILVQSSLMEIKRYLLEISNIISENNNFSDYIIEKIIEGVKWAINVFERSNNLYDYEDKLKSDTFNYKKAITQLKETVDFIITLKDEKKVKEAESIIKFDLKPRLDEWTKNIDILINASKDVVNKITFSRDKVTNQLYKIINNIPRMIKLIETTTIDLQTGNDASAMKNIEIISSTLESIIKLLQIVQNAFSIEFDKLFIDDKISLEDFLKETAKILKDILDALELKDTVLLADLLEYELAPRLEQYIEALKLIIRELNINIH